jgi:hypothetical protein
VSAPERLYPEYQLVVEQFLAAQKLAASLVSSIRRLSEHGAFTAAAIAGLDEDGKDRLDAFIRRFTLLQDIIGAKLFRSVLVIDLEDVPVSMIDVLAAMEKRALIDSMESWTELRKARNDLSHSYREDPEEAAEHLNEALAKAPELLAILERIRLYFVRRGLLPPVPDTPTP